MSTRGPHPVDSLGGTSVRAGGAEDSSSGCLPAVSQPIFGAPGVSILTDQRQLGDLEVSKRLYLVVLGVGVNVYIRPNEARPGELLLQETF